jgi:hypothetical protein
MVQQEIKSNQAYLSFIRLQEGWVASTRIYFPFAVFIALWAIKSVIQLSCLFVPTPDHLFSMVVGQVRVDHLAGTLHVTIGAAHDYLPLCT